MAGLKHLHSFSPSRSRAVHFRKSAVAWTLGSRRSSGLQPPSPDAPGPFRLSDRAALEAVLRASGFKDIRIDSRSMRIDCASAAEYFQIFADIAWQAKIAALSEAEAARFKQAVTDATQPYLEGGRVRLVATSLCASGL